jgi:hypothetical protein
VTLVGAGSDQFTLTQPTSLTLTPGSWVYLHITFDPTTAGVHTPEVRIASSDLDENPHTFTIRGDSRQRLFLPAAFKD